MATKRTKPGSARRRKPADVECYCEPGKVSGMGQGRRSAASGMHWRVALSIITFFGWIIFLILWLFFYAGSYNVYQNIAIFIVSLLAFIAVNGAAWASWGMRYSRG